jgi:hypothetical protein
LVDVAELRLGQEDDPEVVRIEREGTLMDNQPRDIEAPTDHEPSVPAAREEAPDETKLSQTDPSLHVQRNGGRRLKNSSVVVTVLMLMMCAVPMAAVSYARTSVATNATQAVQEESFGRPQIPDNLKNLPEHVEPQRDMPSVPSRQENAPSVPSVPPTKAVGLSPTMALTQLRVCGSAAWSSSRSTNHSSLHWKT